MCVCSENLHFGHGENLHWKKYMVNLFEEVIVNEELALYIFTHTYMNAYGENLHFGGSENLQWKKFMVKIFIGKSIWLAIYIHTHVKISIWEW